MPDDPQPTTPPTTPSPTPTASPTPTLRSQPPGTGPSPKPAGARPPLKPPASKPAPAPVTPEARERGRIMGLAAVGLAAIVAIVVTIGIFLPAIGTMLTGSKAPVDVAKLPDVILVCEREYARSAVAPQSLADVRAADGKDPMLVGIGGGCPEGTCVANSACLTVVYVATTDERFALYELQGGP